MKNNIVILSVICLTLIVFSSSAVTAPTDIIPSPNWTVFSSYHGVKVEYKQSPCEGKGLANHMNYWFKFENTTQQKVSFSWSMKYERDGVCSNCNKLDNKEYRHEITLLPGEVIEADLAKMDDDTYYIFSHFIKLSPGMSNTMLTDFDFVNVQVKPIQ